MLLIRLFILVSFCFFNLSSFSVEIHSAPAEEKYFWPNGNVYYNIDKNYYKSSEIDTIKNAMQKIMENSKVKFIEIENLTESNLNYIQITSGDTCHSEIGMLGGKQYLLLDPIKCIRLGTIIHELMHSIGFYHEQSRFDRDQYIIINWDNILEKRKYNFIPAFNCRFVAFFYG